MERHNIKSECRHIGLKNNRLNYKSKECNDESYKSIKELIEFPNAYQFCNKDLNKFALLLRKDVHPYQYMDSWEKFNETSLLSKESFYRELSKEDIIDEDYEHAQKVWKVFEIKNLGEYHDLYVQSDTLLLGDVLKTLEINVLIFMDLILHIFCQLQD